MKMLTMLLVSLLAPVAFAAPTYYVNCTQLLSAVPIPNGGSIDDIKQGLKGMSLDPETAVPFFNMMKVGNLYFAEKGSDLYLVADKTTFDNDTDPAKEAGFGFGCFIGGSYEKLDKAKFRAEVNSFYQLPADAALFEFKFSN